MPVTRDLNQTTVVEGPVADDPATPFGYDYVVLTKQEQVAQKWSIQYWKGLHGQAKRARTRDRDKAKKRIDRMLEDRRKLANKIAQLKTSRQEDKNRHREQLKKSRAKVDKLKTSLKEKKEENKRLREELASEKAKNRELRKALFGRSSEKRSKKGSRTRWDSADRKSSGKRGQRPGSSGHGRTSRENLPVREEAMEFASGQPVCSVCGRPYATLDETEDSEIVEIEIRAHTRRVRRKKAARACQCADAPGIVTAPPAPRVIPKSGLGVSVLVELLIDKFHFTIPTNRTLNKFRQFGLDLAAGTVTGALKRFTPLFEPLAEEMLNRLKRDALIWADETRWLVFGVESEDKKSPTWYLWFAGCESAAYYCVAPSRGRGVFFGLFRELNELGREIVVVCDRYSVYKSLAQEFPNITLAYCWAHMRRDFVVGAVKQPELTVWMNDWTDRIGKLYALNDERLKAWNSERALDGQSETFSARHEKLKQHVESMKEEWTESLERTDLHPEQRRVQESLERHWEGLTKFVENPRVPMDNNRSERSLRTPVKGRESFYGSRALWSAKLTAIMFTVLTTIHAAGLNLRKWLTAYLEACAEAGGSRPEHFASFLPWNMDETQRRELSKPPSCAQRSPPEQERTCRNIAGGNSTTTT